MTDRKPASYRKRGSVAPQLALVVSQDDIDNGCRQNASQCMLARAVLGRFPDAVYVHCDLKEVSFSLPSVGVRRRYFQTAIGAKNVYHFDQGQLNQLRPFVLRLNDGIEVPMGWRAKHPGSTRVGKVYRRTGNKAVVVYTKRRTFGARNLNVNDLEMALVGTD